MGLARPVDPVHRVAYLMRRSPPKQERTLMTDSAVDLASHPLTNWTGPHGLPAFERLSEEDFAAVIEAALDAHSAEIDRIAANPATPDIENTLAALELAGKPLSRASAIFWVRAGAHTSDTIQALERQAVAAHGPAFLRHPHEREALFARIDALYREREKLGLDPETDRVLEKTWKRFVKAGAQLGAEDKKRLAAINEELAGLGTQFGQNVLADEKDWALFLDEADLDGLPDFLRDSMAEAALRAGRRAFAVTLSRSIYEPFMAFSTRGDLREQAFRRLHRRGRNGGESDNAEIVAQTLKLRAEKARLLGYDTYADLKLDDTMAKTPDAVMGLLEPVWEKAVARVEADAAEMKAIAAEEGSNREIEAWDWRHYAEKLRSGSTISTRPSSSPISSSTMSSRQLRRRRPPVRLTFEELSGMPAWHEDVRVFEVKNADGSHRAIFLADYFNRPTKRSGAWMTGLQSGYRLGEGQSPIIVNVMNFAKPAKGQAALLSMDEARTLFPRIRPRAARHAVGRHLAVDLGHVGRARLRGTALAALRALADRAGDLESTRCTIRPASRCRGPARQDAGRAQFGCRLRHGRVRGVGADRHGLSFRAEAPERSAGLRGGDAGAAGHAGADRHAARHAALPARLFRRRLFSRLLFLHVVGSARRRRLRGLRGDRRSFRSRTGREAAAHIYAAGGSRDPEELYIAFRGRMPSPRR
jgi:peptidyl-dipeptidase Dcp